MPIIATNRYDKLFKKPALEARNMPKILEAYVQRIVKSGILRISAGERCNFVILPVKNGSKFLTFTKKQLSSNKLLTKVRTEIRESLSYDERRNEDAAVDRKIAILQAQLAKYIEIPDEWEIKIARALSQCVPPVVFANMVLEEINLFVSFSHTVSDLLNVQLWKTSKSSQGLQSTSYEESSIFISTGGNPFFDPEESKNEYDGENALARLMIIGAQEIGHWSEVIKNSAGNNIGRFSCSYDKPNPECEEARQKDIENIARIEKIIEKIGTEKVYNLEKKVQVKKKFRKYSFGLMISVLWMKLNQALLIEKCSKYNLGFFASIKEKYLAEEMLSCIADMKFNTEPNSLAYLNPDKNTQKAVFCAEALARVPQQKVKWGNKITRAFTPNLCKYYDMVVKHNRRYFEQKTNVRFKSGTKTKHNMFKMQLL